VLLFTICLYVAQFLPKKGSKDKPCYRDANGESLRLEDVFADDAVKGDDIEVAADFEADAAYGANEKVYFAVEVEGAGGLH